MNKVNQETGEILGFDENHLTQRQVVTMLRLYVENRKLEAAAANAKAQVGRIIKQYLEANPSERELVDGEFNIVAHLQERRTTSYDLTSLSDTDVLTLVSEHVLKVDAAVAKSLSGKSLAVEHLHQHELPGMSVALIVEDRRETQHG